LTAYINDWLEKITEIVLLYFLYYQLLHFAYLNIQVKVFWVKSRDSSVGIAPDYGLDDGGSRVLFPAGAGNSSLHYRIQNGSGAHPAPYPMGTRGLFPWE
jgi:hypothetical protein